MRGLILIAAIALLGAPATAAPDNAAPPFVGCPTDGQLGPQPPAAKPTRTPRLSPELAARLAFYSTYEIGVLAPRGWHCMGLIGSSGSFLIVTPEAHSATEFLEDRVALDGPAVQLSYEMGGTSGRFEVAEIAPRYFPEALPLARSVAEERKEFGMAPSAPPHRFASDRTLRRTRLSVVVETPPGRAGLGSESRLKPNRQPIVSAAMLLPGPDMDLVLLNTRVDATLTDAIVREAQQAYAP